MSTWYNPAWKYALPVAVTNGSSTTALSYAQVPVTLSGSAYTAFHASAKSDGSDIVVTDSDGVTTLPFLLEQIDTVNSVVYLLVKLSLAANASKTIYVYYGNAGASSASSLAGTIGPKNAISSPVDIYNQANGTGFHDVPKLILLQHQDGPNGGGVALNGHILCVMRVENQGGNGGNAGKLATAVSTDGGVSWGSPTIILAPTTSPVNSSVLRAVDELSDGTIVILYGYGTGGTFTLPIYCGRSADGGTTWSNVSATPSNPLTVPWTSGSNGCPYGPILQMSAGANLLVPATGINTAGGDVGYHSWLLTCPFGVDYTNGSNWSEYSVIAFDNLTEWSETWVIPTGPTSLFAAIRNDTGGAGSYDLHYATSTDTGLTWTSPALMGIPGAASNPTASPYFLRLASGNILFLWGIRFGTIFGNGAIVSTNNMATWLDRAVAVPYGLAVSGQNPFCFGYGYAVQRADGKIVMAYYYETGSNLNTTNCASVIFDEDWVVNSPNVYSSCQSTTGLTSVGAQCTVSATQTLNGATDALKFDNTSGNGAVATLPLTSNTAVAVGQNAFTAWVYTTQVAASKANYIIQSDTSATIRMQAGITSTAQLEYFTSAFNQYSPAVSTPFNGWVRLSEQCSVAASSGAGTASVNDGAASTGATPRFNGLNIGSLVIQAGTTSGTSASTFYVGMIYTTQYLATAPTWSVGAQIAAPAPSSSGVWSPPQLAWAGPGTAWKPPQSAWKPPQANWTP